MASVVEVIQVVRHFIYFHLLSGVMSSTPRFLRWSLTPYNCMTHFVRLPLTLLESSFYQRDWKRVGKRGCHPVSLTLRRTGREGTSPGILDPSNGDWMRVGGGDF